MTMAGNSNIGRVQCGKCRAHNEASRNKCRSCGGHLYLICRKCRQKFARFLDLCPSCGENNHHQRDVAQETRFQKLWRKAPQLIFYLILLALLCLVFTLF
jgi:hypothetical protein